MPDQPVPVSSVMLMTAVFAPVAAGIITLFLPRKRTTLRVLISLAGMALAFGLVYAQVAQIAPTSAAGRAGTAVIPWIPVLNLNLAFLADGLGGFFALLVSGIGVLIVLYARGYFGDEPDDLYRFYPTLGFFATAMLGIVLADYTLLTLLFWEMTSISSFLLIGWDRYDKHAVKLAMQAFYTTGLGGLGLLGGILLFGLETDVWRWSEFLPAAGEDSPAWWLPEYGEISWTNPMLGAFLLMFFGAATKSAQFPFHYWLPGAMAAPTPVSAYLHSATMVKAGVFLVARLSPVFWALDVWPWLVIPLGAITMTMAALIAINQHDLKRIFAYTTVSQLGLLMCALGLGALKYTDHHNNSFSVINWDITQIANHAFYKAPLFIIAGALGHVASRDITQLNGVFKKQPAMCITLILAGFALAGLPGSISFQAKELFLYAIYHSYQTIGSWWLILMAAAIVTAVCNVAIFVRLTTTVLGLPGGMTADMGCPAHDDHAHHHHVDATGFWGSMMWVPAAVLVAFQFIGGIAPGVWEYFIRPFETNINYEGFQYLPSLGYILADTFKEGPSIPLICSMIAIACGLILGFLPVFRGAIKDVCDQIYPTVYWLAVTGGRRAFMLVQTGNFRTYTVMVLGAFLIGFAGSVLRDPRIIDPVYEAMSRGGEFWPGILLGAIIIVTALALPLTDSRVVRVLILGACGFAVVGMYLVYRAPDLALTQLMFEIISVLLFVLVLRLLPRDESKSRVPRWWRGLIAAAMGIAFGWMTIVAATTPRDHTLTEGLLLGEMFARHSYKGTELTAGRGGGGDNIVNVILVDFRGFDTLGEITVLALAALGVWSLIPRRRSPKV